MKEKFLNKQFRLTSPKSVNRLVTLSEKMDDEEIKDWDAQEKQGEIFITLKGDNVVYCRLKFSNGKFEGRDVRGGFTNLVPEDPGMQDMKRIYAQPPRRMPRPPDKNDLRRFRNFEQFQEKIDQTVDGYEKTSDKAIAIVGYNRPQYMERVLEGLRKSNLEGFDIYLFLDKPRVDNEESFTEMQAKMAGDITDRLILPEVNFGCGRMLIDVRRQLFDRKQYKRAFIFEDDLVPGPNYLQFCENLLDWGLSNYTNVGAVQGWTKCLLPQDQKKRLTKQVHCTYTNWWGYLTTKDAWDKVKSVLYTYRDEFLKGDYALRPVVPILQYFKPMTQKNFHLEPGGIQPDTGSLAHRRRLFDAIPSGQDGATWLAYDNANMVRLAPSVNRSLYIGEIGIHSTVKSFQKDRFDKMTLDVVPQDARMRNFELRK